MVYLDELADLCGAVVVGFVVLEPVVEEVGRLPVHQGRPLARAAYDRTFQVAEGLPHTNNRSGRVVVRVLRKYNNIPSNL